MPESIQLSIVSPVYGCSAAIPDLCRRLHITLSGITDRYEIILIEDGSPDDSWERILTECKSDSRVKGIRLSRNFGQHYAITAGLDHATGEWVVVMDCDLQDQPEEIPKLYAKTQEGFYIVFAQRENRQDKFLKKMTSKLFYWIFSYLTGTQLDSSIANFGIYNCKSVKAILSMNDQIRYFPTMSQWVGFRKTCLTVQHAARENGRSSYSIRKLLKLACDNMIAFSDKPLRLVVKLGMTICILTVLIACHFLYKYLHGDIEVLGYASLILSIWLLGGTLIFILGIVGIYIGKTFDQSKCRPKYIVEEYMNDCNKN